MRAVLMASPWTRLLVGVERSLASHPDQLARFLGLPAGGGGETLDDALHNQIGVYPITGPGERQSVSPSKSPRLGG